MKQLNFAVQYEDSVNPTSQLKSFANLTTGNYGASKQGLINLLTALTAQTFAVKTLDGNNAYNVQLGGVAASAVGTFTGQPTAADTFTLGGQAITARASGAVVNEFNIGSTTQATCQNLVDAINNSTTANVSKCVKATYEDASTAQATAYLNFTGQPSATQTAVINGVTFTARASGASTNEFNIGTTTYKTVENLLAAMQASTSSGTFQKISGAITSSTGVQATAVLNMTGNPSNSQYFSINAVVFTAKTSGAFGNEFNIASGDPTTTADRIVAAFNDSTDVNGLFEASVAANAGDPAEAVLTLTGLPSADQTFTVNGVVFTAKAAGATGNQFNIGADETETATNIKTAVNASVSAGVAGLMTADSAAGVVTFTADDGGSFANAWTSTETMSNASFGDTTFTGGTDDIDITFTVLAAGSAGNAYASVEAMSNATMAGATFAGGTDDITLTFTSNQAGTVGNAYTLSETMSNCTRSGATFTGGVDAVKVNVISKIPGLLGNFYTVTESMNNFTVTGSGKLAGGTASDYYEF